MSLFDLSNNFAVIYYILSAIWFGGLIITSFLLFCWTWVDDSLDKVHCNPIIKYIMCNWLGFSVNHNRKTWLDYYYIRHGDSPSADGVAMIFGVWGLLTVGWGLSEFVYKFQMVGITLLIFVVIMFASRFINRLSKKVKKLENI